MASVVLRIIQKRRTVQINGGKHKKKLAYKYGGDNEMKRCERSEDII